MAAHRCRRHGGVACLNAVDNPLVLFDDQCDRRGFIQADIADAVHLGLDAFDDAPGVGSPDRQRDRAMKLFVECQELDIVAGFRCALLFNQAAQLLDR